MQNLFRFLLAWLVVIAHLTEGVQLTAHWGVFAVFGFYLLSGFLITLILNEVYNFQLSSFALNRFLRLYPVYYLIALFTLLFVVGAPNAGEYKSLWAIDPKPMDFVANALIFPFEFYENDFRLIPPAWSVAVELLNYFLLWLIVARNKKFAIAALLISIAVHTVIYLEDPFWRLRYMPAYAALLPFSLGACIYFAKDFAAKISPSLLVKITAALFVIWLANLVGCGLSGSYRSDHFDLFFYANLILQGGLVFLFSHPAFAKRATGMAKFLGNLSYPVFLVHWQIGFAVVTVFGLEEIRGWIVLAISAPFIFLFAWLSVFFTDRLIEPVRDRVRPGSQIAAGVPAAQAL